MPLQTFFDYQKNCKKVIYVWIAGECKRLAEKQFLNLNNIQFKLDGDYKDFVIKNGTVTQA